VRWKKFTQHSGGSLVVDFLFFLSLQLCIEGFITVTFGLSALLRLHSRTRVPSLPIEGSLVSLLELDIGAPFTLDAVSLHASSPLYFCISQSGQLVDLALPFLSCLL
jgi:hypothetical protein